MPATVEPSITDSITQVNTKVLGDAPAQAMGTLYQTASATSGIALQNAVHAQNNQYALNNAAAVEGVNLLYTSPTAASAAASTKIDAGFEGVMAKIDGLILNTRSLR
ncbi:probable RebB like protein [Plesiocystis pacifica SIR-1]|uniref:Probable RebB like protein n=1 Tax=Plesiocystis pacifica SIR-1 TaxID=391625 RepID=A6GI08_9BACT|nr:RebB family R body protein [Plesiocystis pacifica]EDM74515.1 probable RebB like protein [Plesiocystis pacifica SIR-1]